MVANCLPNSEKAGQSEDEKKENVTEKDCESTFEHGNPVSHRDINSIPGASKIPGKCNLCLQLDVYRLYQFIVARLQ